MTAPFLLRLLLVLAATSASVRADSTAVRRIHDGVLHMRVVRDDGPWVINALIVDLSHPDISVCGVRALDSTRGREKTSAMAARVSDSLWEALAAVNADFFEVDGETVGLAVVEGRWVRAAPPHRSTGGEEILRTHFALTETGVPLLGQFRFEGRIWSRGREPIPLAAVNADGRGGSILFTLHAGMITPHDTSAVPGLEMPLDPAGFRGDTLFFVAVRNGTRGGSSTLPAGGIVVRVHAPGTDTLLARPGDTVAVTLRVAPFFGSIRTMVGGMPRLLAGGRPTEESEQENEGAPEGFRLNRHPRTGVGISRDSTVLLLVTVDGRQEASAGMTLQEFSGLLGEFGVWEGLNLDGGGSTTMVVGDSVVNSPSDANGERPVANCLVVRARRR